MRTIFITAVVDDFDQIHDSIMKLNATRFKKDTQQVLFVYNIGTECETADFSGMIQEPKLLCIHNAEPLPEIVSEFDVDDKQQVIFSSRREVAVPGQPYGKDYQRAFVDAGTVAQKLIDQLGFEVAFDDFKFYNFFNKPKYRGNETKIKELEAVKSIKKEN